MTDADTGSGASLAGPWRGVLAGDKDAYRRAVEPHLPELLAAAARELATAARWAICDPRT
jgi:hypothetical protein